MTPAIHAVLAIAIMAAVTFLTRALPFLLFDRGGNPPKLVLYLGRVLPPAIIAMLIIYCLKGPLLALRDGFPHLLSLQAAGEWLPAFLSVLVVALLHLWKRNTLLSIFGGTVLYMVLIQAVFP